MKLSISQILTESWEDFKKLLINPIVFILFLVSSSLSILPDFIQEDTPPLLVLLIIPLALLMLFIYAYQVKLIYSLKTGGTQNIFSEVLSAYPRYLWYTLIFMSIIIVTALVFVLIPAIVLYILLGDLDIALPIILILYAPVLTYISVRLFFYIFLIILDKNTTPLATSWQLTKKNLWKLILLFIILITAIFLSAFAIAFPLLLFLKLPETTIDIILLPLDALASIYVATAFMNAYLSCRPQPVAAEVGSENQSI